MIDEIDECDGCVKQIFADNWVDFINDYCENHPEFVKAYKEFKIKSLVKRISNIVVNQEVKHERRHNRKESM